MKTVVLCVDRDNDIGEKASLRGPFIGREKNLEAAMALGMADPEDPDSNTVLSAIGIYDELLKRGLDVQVATICGSQKVGFESDRLLSEQLEEVMDTVKPDRAILVSNGAEDEYFYPVIASRIKIDSVKRVFIKQTPTAEGLYYIMIKTLKDPKLRRKLLSPFSAILIVYGFFLMFSDLVILSNTHSIGYISGIAPGLITFLIGLYIAWYAYNVTEGFRSAFRRLWKAMRSGSQMLPFAILSGVLIVVGVLYALSTVTQARNVPVQILAFVFIYNFLWIGVFAALVFETGRFTNTYFSKRKISWSSIIAGLMFVALGMILQGALDAIVLLYRLGPVNETLIGVETISGILIAMFGGLLNSTIHGQEETALDTSEEKEGAELSTRAVK
jgi:putative membrane protein